MPINFISVLGIFMITISAIYFTNKKFVVSRWYGLIFITIVSIASYINQLPMMPVEYLITYIIGITLILAIACFFTRGSYEVFNADKVMVMNTLISILESGKIAYEHEEDAFILKDYEDKRISYSQQLSESTINFKEIRKLPFYKTLKKEFVSSIKQIETTIFPSTGIVVFLMGGILVIISLVFRSR